MTRTTKESKERVLNKVDTINFSYQTNLFVSVQNKMIFVEESIGRGARFLAAAKTWDEVWRLLDMFQKGLMRSD